MPGKIPAMLAVLAGLTIVSCGGGVRQDANEPSGVFKVAVSSASFPAQQQLGSHNTMSIGVRNDGSQPLPNVSVTLSGLDYTATEANLANPQRPIWIVVTGPFGGITANNDTWALGRLPAGQTATFTWSLTAIRAGTYNLGYRVSAGLNGKAVAQLDNGAIPAGTFPVTVASAPLVANVNPTTGQVVTTAQQAAQPAVPVTPNTAVPSPNSPGY